MIVFGHILGTIAGFVGITIAIYLQLIAKRQVDWRYVVGFYILGVSILIGNIEAFGAPDTLTGMIMGTAYVLLIFFEMTAAYWVYENSDLESPTDLLFGEVNGTRK